MIQVVPKVLMGLEYRGVQLDLVDLDLQLDPMVQEIRQVQIGPVDQIDLMVQMVLQNQFLRKVLRPLEFQVNHSVQGDQMDLVVLETQQHLHHQALQWDRPVRLAQLAQGNLKVQAIQLVQVVQLGLLDRQGRKIQYHPEVPENQPVLLIQDLQETL